MKTVWYIEKTVIRLFVIFIMILGVTACASRNADKTPRPDIPEPSEATAAPQSQAESDEPELAELVLFAESDLADSEENPDSEAGDQGMAATTTAPSPEAENAYQAGLSLCCGYGPGFDTAAALSQFCRAAMAGHAGAQYELGRFFARRADTHLPLKYRQDLIYAYLWYSVAALQSDHLAAAERDALARDLSDSELEEAKTHLRDWQTLGCPLKS